MSDKHNQCIFMIKKNKKRERRVRWRMVDFINIQMNRDILLYDGRVKNHYSNRGAVRLKEDVDVAYVIFPIYRMDNDDDVVVAIDEILFKPVEMEREGTYKIELSQEYIGRKCVVIDGGQPIDLVIGRKEVIYGGDVKQTHNGQGLVRLKNSYLGKRAYVIFPNSYDEDDDGIFISVREIYNKGIHSNNDHTCRVLLDRGYIGDGCFVILQEG